MGRWATASRRGGSRVAPTDLAQMVRAIWLGGQWVHVYYNQNISYADLLEEDFVTLTTGGEGSAFSDQLPNNFLLRINIVPIGGEDLQYQGAAPGFLSPDSVQLG